MENKLHILMVAAENDGLPNGKVGGIGDVLRDIPSALADLEHPDCHVTVVVPSYGFLHSQQGARLVGAYGFRFGGKVEPIDLYQVPGKAPHSNVTQLVLHHPSFQHPAPASGKLTIYYDDPPNAPFATDATKFARFCAAIAEGLREQVFGPVDRLHLHDWHTGFFFILRHFDPTYQTLKSIRTVFTIHNLALQGIRPRTGHASSFQAWYPHLSLSMTDLQAIGDPEYVDCVNPMALGIRFADAVHVVSPGYQAEILSSTIPKRGDPNAFSYGGEGLEADLQHAQQEKRLFGILNGCEYDNRSMPTRNNETYRDLLSPLSQAVSQWQSRTEPPVHRLARTKLAKLQSIQARPSIILTAVSRVVHQKVRLMQLPETTSALEQILKGISPSGLFILLGAGSKELERFLYQLSERFPNFIFLNAYDNACANALYAQGDLFLMPSSFEPCGISQMLAMRDGQPCVVHHVGGLKDTVEEGKTGFAFSGKTPEEQANNFASTVLRAVDLFTHNKDQFEAIRTAAFHSRFPWKTSVKQYVSDLYHA